MKLPQVSLRELFLLVVIAAMGCGWWVEHVSTVHRLERAERAANWFKGNLRILGYEAFWDGQNSYGIEEISESKEELIDYIKNLGTNSKE